MPKGVISKPRKSKIPTVMPVSDNHVDLPVAVPIPVPTNEILELVSLDNVKQTKTKLKEKTKRIPKGKAKGKQTPIVAIVSANGEIQGTFTPEPRRPLIAHLPFRSSEIQFQDGPLMYDPRPPGVPEPYEADDLYTSNAELIEVKVTDELKPVLPPAVSESILSVSQNVSVCQTQVQVKQEETRAFRTIDVMLEYRVANETRTLPECVDAACFWCAGCFEGYPIVIPSLEERGVYSVYGNFCTLSCGLSYLLNEQVDPQVRWERQALLNRMYKQTSAIHPAPPRESLTLFGGSLSHEQFRNIIEKKVLRVDRHIHPVISILATLDTKPIDFYETSLKNTSVNASLSTVEQMKNSEPGLRLKRSKPLKDKESTLDAVMNLHVKVRT
jgi:hypothetical protein